jgi:hypothetical protein
MKHFGLLGKVKTIYELIEPVFQASSQATM